MSRMPIAAGSPKWTGAPCASGKRRRSASPSIAWAGVIGRIDTTIGPRKRPAGRHGDVRAVHRHVAALLDVPHRHAGLSRAFSNVNEQPSRKPTRSSRQQPREVGRLVDQLAVAVDAVARHVGAQVGPGGDAPRLRVARLGHVEQRARLRVALAEQQEVERQVPRHDDEVGLDVARGQAGRRAGRVRRRGSGAHVRPRSRVAGRSLSRLPISPMRFSGSAYSSNGSPSTLAACCPVTPSTSGPCGP